MDIEQRAEEATATRMDGVQPETGGSPTETIPVLLLSAKSAADNGDYAAAILSLDQAASLGASGDDAVLEAAESLVRKGSQIGWSAVRALLHSDGSEFHVAEAVVHKITSQFIETFTLAGAESLP